MKKKYFLLLSIGLFVVSTFGFFNNVFALDPKLKDKFHSDIKVLEIDKGNVDKIWGLRENPKLADIIINKAEKSCYESSQVEILDKWVQNGGCLWLKEPLPIAHDWNFVVEKPLVHLSKIHFENKKDMVCILSHPIVEGIKILSLGNVKVINKNFDNEVDVILQYEGIPKYSRGYTTKVFIVPFGSSDFDIISEKQASYKPWKGIKLQPQIFPILVVKNHGKGKVLFGDFVIKAEYDWERFELNIKEWGAGYPVPETVVDYSNPKAELNVNPNEKLGDVDEGIISIGNLRIVSFDPTKEKNTAYERAKSSAHKLAELFVQRQIGKAISYFAGNIASKVLSPVTTLISQMPSVGNPTEIECYFIVREDVVKKGEVNIGEPFGLLVYISQGDLLKDLTIELKKDIQIVYSEDVSASFLSEHYGRILLIASYPPLSMSESGTYRLTAIYGEPKSSATLQIKPL